MRLGLTCIPAGARAAFALYTTARRPIVAARSTENEEAFYSMSIRQPRFSGRIPDNHPWHYVVVKGDRLPTANSTGLRLAPHYVSVARIGKIPVWGPKKKDVVRGFRPAEDCSGKFMSYRYQPNNNCYNYACNIATNSFAQPGRRHGLAVPQKGKTLRAEDLIEGAKKDGLKFVGDGSLAQALKSPTYRNGLAKGGHLVALLLSPARSIIRWKGDFHWVRCDHPSGRIWSQKDGPDQVTNFDFYGDLIVDPSKASWTVNLGPPMPYWGYKSERMKARLVTYRFVAWMFVPCKRVSII